MKTSNKTDGKKAKGKYPVSVRGSDQGGQEEDWSLLAVAGRGIAHRAEHRAGRAVRLTPPRRVPEILSR